MTTCRARVVLAVALIGRGAAAAVAAGALRPAAMPCHHPRRSSCDDVSQFSAPAAAAQPPAQ